MLKHETTLSFASPVKIVYRLHISRVDSALHHQRLVDLGWLVRSGHSFFLGYTVEQLDVRSPLWPYTSSLGSCRLVLPDVWTAWYGSVWWAVFWARRV